MEFVLFVSRWMEQQNLGNEEGKKENREDIAERGYICHGLCDGAIHWDPSCLLFPPIWFLPRCNTLRWSKVATQGRWKVNGSHKFRPQVQSLGGPFPTDTYLGTRCIPPSRSNGC